MIYPLLGEYFVLAIPGFILVRRAPHMWKWLGNSPTAEGLRGLTCGDRDAIFYHFWLPAGWLLMGVVFMTGMSFSGLMPYALATGAIVGLSLLPFTGTADLQFPFEVLPQRAGPDDPFYRLVRRPR